MFRLLSLSLIACLVGCDAKSPAPTVAAGSEAGIEVLFPVHQGKQLTKLRLAATELEKARGLMGTKVLPPNEGMAFLYEEDTQMHFWMKDTPLSLDIAFVGADGKILEIKTMQAFDTNTTSSTSDKVRFTVEMAAGWFATSGVKVGDQVDLTELKAGLTARGFTARRYLPLGN